MSIMTNNIRRYSDLILLPTFEERFKYLQLQGAVGETTFGYERYLNQVFYHSKQWRSIRDFVILRDNGCDLGVSGYEISNHILIHHLNPIQKEDIMHESEFLLNPEYLICVSHNTHNAIHYCNDALLLDLPKERAPNDTKLW